MQQISLSQRVTKNELEAKMDGLKNGLKNDMEVMMNVNMEGFKDGLKTKMKRNLEDLKEGLTKLLQEMLPSDDKVLHENHDEDKRNTNFAFRDSNSGLRTNHIPKINMRNFDGKDMITWILWMEQFFDLHDVSNTQKVHIASLYLGQN